MHAKATDGEADCRTALSDASQRSRCAIRSVSADVGPLPTATALLYSLLRRAGTTRKGEEKTATGPSRAVRSPNSSSRFEGNPALHCAMYPPSCPQEALKGETGREGR